MAKVAYLPGGQPGAPSMIAAPRPTKATTVTMTSDQPLEFSARKMVVNQAIKALQTPTKTLKSIYESNLCRVRNHF